MGLYRLLVGKHVQADPDAPEPKPDPATGLTPKKRSKVYKAGDIVPSDVDLVAKLGHEKFERLEEGKPVPFPPPPPPAPKAKTFPPPRQQLEAMTVEELKALAAAEEVDLHGAGTKNEIIKSILVGR